MEKSESGSTITSNKNSVSQKKNYSSRISIIVLVTAGLIVAAEIIMERVLAISTDTSRYSFAFVARVISGVTLGPVMAGITGIVSDTIGAFIRYGSINPLLTAIAFLRGITYGVFLYKKRTPLRIIGAVLTEQIGCSLILSTAALSIWYGYSFEVIFIGRVIQCAIMTAIQLVTIFTLDKFLFGRLIKILDSYKHKNKIM